MKNFTVYWDGYGISSRGSGISHVACMLGKELTSIGIYPNVIKPHNQPSLIEKATYHNLSQYGPLDGVLSSKLIWPLRVRRYLQGYNSNNRGVQILHGLSNFNISLGIKKLTNTRSVLTIHDLIPLLDKGCTSKPLYYQMAYYLPKVVDVVDRIICVSHWAKKSLIDFFPQVKDKIDVVPNGFPTFRGFTPKESNRDGLINILSVSRYEKYKRFDLLVDILKKSQKNLRLTIVTDKRGVDWAYQNYSDLISSSYLTIKTGLSKEDLEKEYRNTDVYVHTSLYEGFCLPASEALAFGKPVVYQSGSAIDEVVGKEAGRPMIQSESSESWCKAIIDIEHFSHLDQFKDKIKDRVERNDNWSDAAKSIASIYKDLAGGK